MTFPPQEAGRASYVERQATVERVQALTRSLRAAHVGVPERAAAAALALWAAAERKCEPAGKVRATRTAVSALCAPTDRCAPQEAPETQCGAYVTRANLARSAVAAQASALRAHPLGGRNYDDFPLQEDALAVR